ncbi:MAG: STAS domain-containing protein [Pseudomonadota bacterium]
MSSTYISGEGGNFQISGELSFKTVNAVLAESKVSIFAEAATQLDLDLGNVARADSAGLALLIQWMRMAREHDTNIRFHHLPKQLLAIARAGELDTLLPVAE